MSLDVTVVLIATTVGSVTTLLSKLLSERSRRQQWRESARIEHVRQLPEGSRIADVSGSAIFIEVGASSTPRGGAQRDFS